MPWLAKKAARDLVKATVTRNKTKEIEEADAPLPRFLVGAPSSSQCM
jgi:hypothetical protein